MAIDHIRYDLLAQDALRGLVRRVLTDAAKSGLPGEHHFSITFRTGDEGVRMSQRLREQFPQEMTIILQHQFGDLAVTEHGFEVGLSFSGVPERLLIPFDAGTGRECERDQHDGQVRLSSCADHCQPASTSAFCFCPWAAPAR